MRLTEAMEAYLKRNPARFHMPGHKGQPLPLIGEGARWDLTEAAGLDSLYQAEGCIRETEREYAALYGSADCVLSAGGATLCIQAMLATALRPGERLLVGRGVHTAAVNAMALLDLHPVWLLPAPHKATGLSGPVTLEAVAEALAETPGIKAVYLTSPTYFGVISDIAGIGAVCRAHGVPLLVDNAHGAHLAFLPRPIHPMALGADFCCDSLHKTLPVLTGGALLHMRNGEQGKTARKKMSLFGSTSPSYLIMLSASAALDYLHTAKVGFAAACSILGEVAEAAKARGFALPDFPVMDPMRLTLGGAPLGYTGEELGAYLREKNIEPEYAEGGFCVLMASPFNGGEDFARLREALERIPAHTPRRESLSALTAPSQAVSLREAAFAETVTLPVERAVGRISGSLVAPCPPGLALLVAGERVDKETAALLKSYGISHVDVVK